MSKSPPRKCRLLWLCLLTSAFLLGMPAAYATEDCSRDLPEPSVDIASDSDGVSFSADFGDSNPDKYCWVVGVRLLTADLTPTQAVSNDCDETDDHFSNGGQSFSWAATGIDAGGSGLMRAKVRAQHTSCPSRWSEWGDSGYKLVGRPSGE